MDSNAARRLAHKVAAKRRIGEQRRISPESLLVFPQLFKFFHQFSSTKIKYVLPYASFQRISNLKQVESL
jgi:hypothetical protein